MTSRQVTTRTFRGADGGPERISPMRAAPGNARAAFRAARRIIPDQRETIRNPRIAFRPARRIIRHARMTLRALRAAAG